MAQLGKYRLSRRGRKLQVSDDQRTLMALPKEVPERTWAEILQKEENELIAFDVREEILEDALRIGYDNYMEKQTTLFAAHCAAQAWLKLIDWQFYRHDPGEDPSAHPPCYIPKRVESWEPDEMPDPSPKDTWGQHQLAVLDDSPDEGLARRVSATSLNLPVIEAIPRECWFPGKVNLPVELEEVGAEDDDTTEIDEAASSSGRSAGSELLQKVTDYSLEELSIKESNLSALKTTSPVEASLHGAGDSVLRRRRPSLPRTRVFSRPSSIIGRSKAALPPLDVGDSRSRISAISDCRLRNLRLDTQYEISSEKVDTPPGEVVRRK